MQTAPGGGLPQWAASVKKALRKGRAAEPSEVAESTASCDMVRVAAGFDLHGPDAKPGMFCWNFGFAGEEVHRVLWHILPEGSVGCIPIEPLGPKTREALKGRDGKTHTWEWDGNLDKPTLKPSVHLIGRWHGWFRHGQMKGK